MSYDEQDLYNHFEDYDAQEIRDREQIEQAKQLARMAHEGQMRDEGTPYFEHVNRVAERLIEMHELPANIIIAYLHDTIEDTKVTYDDIKKQFGVFVADGVQGLTKDKTDPAYSLENYLKNIVNHEISTLVDIKILDRIDNIKSLSQCPSKKKVERYITETKQTFIPIMFKSKYMKTVDYARFMVELEKELDNVIDKVGTNKLTYQSTESIGIYGKKRKRFLEEHRKETLNFMITEGTLKQHLMQVDEECTEKVWQLTEQLAEAWEITEELKVTDMLKWVGLMNNAKHSAEEIVMKELIYI